MEILILEFGISPLNSLKPVPLSKMINVSTGIKQVR